VRTQHDVVCIVQAAGCLRFHVNWRKLNYYFIIIIVFFCCCYVSTINDDFLLEFVLLQYDANSQNNCGIYLLRLSMFIQLRIFKEPVILSGQYGARGSYSYNQRINIWKWRYILIWSDTPQILELPFLALLWHTCWTSILLKMKVLCSFEWSLTACFVSWRHIAAEQILVRSRHL